MTSKLFRTLSLRWTDIADLADIIEQSSPFASRRLRWMEQVLTKPDRRRELLHQFKIDAACLLTQVYDVRNQLVHDANPFGFDDAYRLHVLYDRYRALINPVVAEVLRIVVGHPGTPLAHAWSLLRARFEEVVDVAIAGGSVSDARIRACLLGR